MLKGVPKKFKTVATNRIARSPGTIFIALNPTINSLIYEPLCLGRIFFTRGGISINTSGVIAIINVRISTHNINSIGNNKKTYNDLEINDFFPLFLKCSMISFESTINFWHILIQIIEQAGILSTQDDKTFFINKIFEKEKIILLIDGLDEISDEQNRINFVNYLLKFLKNYSNIPVIITSREPGFRIIKEKIENNFDLYEIINLNELEKASLVKNWFSYILQNREGTHEMVDNFIEELNNNQKISKLANNPLFLLIFISLKLDGQKLPTKKDVVLQRLIEQLIHLWNIEGYQPLDLSSVQAQLGYLAYYMSKEGLHRILYYNLIQIILFLHVMSLKTY